MRKLLASSLLLALAACKPSAPPPAPTPPPAEAPKAGNRKMANCPSRVDGAKVAHADTADGVEVTITASAAEAVAQIRERTKHLVEVAAKNPDKASHSGEGDGGGMLGRCPVVLNDTTLASADVEGGVKVTIKPNKPENLDWLKKEVAAREAAPAN